MEGRRRRVERLAGVAFLGAPRGQRRVPVVVRGDAGPGLLGVREHGGKVRDADAAREPGEVRAALVNLVEARGVSVEPIQVGREFGGNVGSAVRDVGEALLVPRQPVVVARSVREGASSGLDRRDHGELVVPANGAVGAGGSRANRLGIVEHAGLRIETRVLPSSGARASIAARSSRSRATSARSASAPCSMAASAARACVQECHVSR
ncbi:hypothetical protein GCM10025876_35490 [Demequina litorisediminis]|uniref:Uncharacterized protein n=1 Tax=Demequina litorisediminis TaxID=1849022 RepID=A0ABQ6IHH4_9MICO|nr:hypothetical protein GCM10025876_35490 [Demequina litorisediminis]